MKSFRTAGPVPGSTSLPSGLSPAANICHAIEKRSACDEKYRGGDVFEVVAASRYSTLLLADVSSKGTLSLEHTEVIRRRFRDAVWNERSPARILEILNGVVLDDKNNPDRVTFASAIVATFDRESPALTYSSAGHDIGLIIRGNAHQHLVPSGPVLGVIPAAAFFDRSESFDSDASLIVATDGFTECREPSRSLRQFGTTGIVKAAISSSRASCSSIARAIALSADRFTSTIYRDDATLAVIARPRNWRTTAPPPQRSRRGSSSSGLRAPARHSSLPP
jgi:serine phosphatase RsbU (regulator of sigma subunit)